MKRSSCWSEVVLRLLLCLAYLLMRLRIIKPALKLPSFKRFW